MALVGMRAKVDFFVRAKVDGLEQSPCGFGMETAPQNAKKQSVRAKVDRLVCAQKWTALLPVLRQLARPPCPVLKRIPVDDVEAVWVDDEPDVLARGRRYHILAPPVGDAVPA